MGKLHKFARGIVSTYIAVAEGDARLEASHTPQRQSLGTFAEISAFLISPHFIHRIYFIIFKATLYIFGSIIIFTSKSSYLKEKKKIFDLKVTKVYFGIYTTNLDSNLGTNYIFGLVRL